MDRSDGAKHILHICVFKSGLVLHYINFMKLAMNGYRHRFVVSDRSLKFVDVEDIIYTDHTDQKRALLCDASIRQAMRDAQMVIVAPASYPHSVLGLLPSAYQKKMYLYFIDHAFALGSAPPVFDLSRCLKWHIHHILRRRLYSNCAGCLFLLDEEYEPFHDEWGGLPLIGPRRILSIRSITRWMLQTILLLHANIRSCAILLMLW